MEGGIKLEGGSEGGVGLGVFLWFVCPWTEPQKSKKQENEQFIGFG